MSVERPTQITYDKKKPILVMRSVVVRVIEGPDKDACITLGDRRVRIGTAAANDLRLSDQQVSRCHLEFQVQDQGYLVRDLQSTNGTFYRGARVGEVVVGQGSELRIGSTVLRLERSRELSEVIEGQQQFGSLIGTSRAMQQVYGMLSAVAPTDVTVLLEGETGTGKELVAEELHRHSPRCDKLFSVVDCGTLPANLIESELFGHERGAFTGAVSERVGVFEKTRGGTVFLDEIGELPLPLQTRLLRVLDRRTIRRVGSNLPRKIDVRLVAATNRDLKQEVAAQRFRKDLYYRLAVMRIVLPPLRERREDISHLARHFLWQAGCANPEAVLTDEVLDVFSTRSWPGNIRELRNVIERATVMADGAALDVASVSPSPVDPKVPTPPPLPPVPAPPASPSSDTLALPPSLLELDYKSAKEQLLHTFETVYLGRLIDRHGSNVSRIARDAGVDRHLVRKLLRKHKLNA